jgi:hypothetical protein
MEVFLDAPLPERNKMYKQVRRLQSNRVPFQTVSEYTQDMYWVKN